MKVVIDGVEYVPTNVAQREFRIGDFVRVRAGAFGPPGAKGICGRIVSTYSGQYGVEFADNVGGHTLHDSTRMGHGWYFPSGDLELVE